MSAIDWEDLRHFDTLARTLNLASAAAELRTSQVTVMRRVKALESALNTTLFLRRRDGHRLTPTGADFVKATREASDLIATGVRRIVAHDGKSEGHVRIATTELAANWILLPRLSAFQQANAGIALEIDASPAAVGLTDDAETLALRFHRPQAGPFRIRKLGEISFGLYQKIGLSPANAADAPFQPYIGWAGDFHEISLSRWLRRTHQSAKPALALTTFEGHLKAARLGLGVAALPDFIGSSELALERASDPAEPFALEAWLVVPAQIAATARVRKASHFIEQAVGAVRSKLR